MGVLEIASYIVTASIGGFALLRILNDSRKNLCSVILNAMLGGTLFTILNIMGLKIALNFITGGIILLLGVPGVVLKNWLGHSDIHITLDTYAHVFSKMDNEAINKFDDYIDEL